MKVKEIIRLFDLLQEVEIYPVVDGNDYFMYEEEVSSNTPIFEGQFKDMPYYIAECELDESGIIEGYPVIDCRRYMEGGTKLVFSVKESD